MEWRERGDLLWRRHRHHHHHLCCHGVLHRHFPTTLTLPAYTLEEVIAEDEDQAEAQGLHRP